MVHVLNGVMLMRTQRGFACFSAALSMAGLILLGLAVAGCSTRRGYTEGYDKACFYSEAGQKAESDYTTAIIRTAKEDTRKKPAFFEYRANQNALDLAKAKIKGFWGNMTAPVNNEEK